MFTSMIFEAVFIDSPLGSIKVEGSENGISAITILDERVAVSDAIPLHFENAVKQLDEYFNKKRSVFTFNIQMSGTSFQVQVWKALLEIPYGKTCSYLDLAKKLGNPKAVRAVANANGKNPLLIIVPCHRIIGSDKSLTGYVAGLWRKKWLLEHENILKQVTLF